MQRPSRLGPLLLILAALVFVANVLALHPPRFGGDTSRYVDGARHLLGGMPFQEKEASYIGYDAVVAAAMAAGSGPVAVVTLQIVMTIAAALVLRRMGRELYGEAGGVAAAILVLVNRDVALWASYLLTDSLYISFVAFAVCAIHEARTRRRVLLTVAVVAFTALLRPKTYRKGSGRTDAGPKPRVASSCRRS